ncbi:hypothetical protein DPV78_005089 [Talaromyces pinophilus]|nr:hypothetical protein DPV78_005089 [Talaromyces pinophilus]
MDAPYWIFIAWALLITAPVLVQAQTTTQQSSDESDSDGGESNSFIGHKTKIIIIVVSVVAGVVVLFSVASSILYVIAKRRQWAVRETIRRSARRMADAIKSPLTPRFPRSDGESSKSQTSSYMRRQSRRARQNRSSRGMTRIAEETGSPQAPYILKDDDDVSALVDSRASRESNERYVTTTKSIWRHSHSESNGSNTTATKNNISAESYFFDFGPKPAGRNNSEKKPQKSKQKRPDFDLERGIELGATDHMKVTVSLSTTKDSDKSVVESPSKKSWGSLFAFGRR